MRARGLCCVLALACAAGCGGLTRPGESGAPSTNLPIAAPQMLLVPEAGRLYHGVLPRGTTEPDSDVSQANLDGYETGVGRKGASAYFSTDWFRSLGFPTHTASWRRTRGAVPFIRLMM